MWLLFSQCLGALCDLKVKRICFFYLICYQPHVTGFISVEMQEKLNQLELVVPSTQDKPGENFKTFSTFLAKAVKSA